MAITTEQLMQAVAAAVKMVLGETKKDEKERTGRRRVMRIHTGGSRSLEEARKDGRPGSST
jgi:hypothetical protein